MKARIGEKAKWSRDALDTTQFGTIDYPQEEHISLGQTPVQSEEAGTRASESNAIKSTRTKQQMK